MKEKCSRQVAGEKWATNHKLVGSAQERKENARKFDWGQEDLEGFFPWVG